MHVIHVTTSFPASDKDCSGLFILRTVNKMNAQTEVVIPAHDAQKLNNLVSSGQTHWVRYAPKKWSLITSTNQYGGIPENLKLRPYLIFLYPLMMVTLLWKTWKLANAETVLHAHWLPNGIIAAIVKKFKKNPFVITIRGADEKLFSIRLLRPLVRGIFSSADAITTVSQRLKDEISKQFHMEGKTHYIPNGVELPDVSPGDSDEKFKLLYVGSLIPRKGIDDLIMAVAQVKNRSQFQLEIAGSGWERDRLLDLVEEKKLSDVIQFLGVISPLRVPSKMLESDALVLPTYSEGTPNVIKEAMACALPVITTDVGGIPELITHEKEGLLFKPGDVNTLTQHIEFMMEHKSEAKKMGQNGRQFIIDQDLTWEKTAENYLNLYQEIS
jgi:glycosyltransferase involved in cell wall biosynthesis